MYLKGSYGNTRSENILIEIFITPLKIAQGSRKATHGDNFMMMMEVTVRSAPPPFRCLPWHYPVCVPQHFVTNITEISRHPDITLSLVTTRASCRTDYRTDYIYISDLASPCI